MPQIRLAIYHSEDVHEQEKSNPVKTRKCKTDSKRLDPPANVFTRIYLCPNAGKRVFLRGTAAFFFDGLWDEEFATAKTGR